MLMLLHPSSYVNIQSCLLLRIEVGSDKGQVKSYPWTDLERSRGHLKMRLPGLFRQSAHDGGKVVSPTNRPPLPPRKTELKCDYNNEAYNTVHKIYNIQESYIAVLGTNISDEVPFYRG